MKEITFIQDILIMGYKRNIKNLKLDKRLEKSYSKDITYALNEEIENNFLNSINLKIEDLNIKESCKKLIQDTMSKDEKIELLTKRLKDIENGKKRTNI